MAAVGLDCRDMIAQISQARSLKNKSLIYLFRHYVLIKERRGG